MDLNKKSMKKIRELIVFTAILVVALWKFDTVLEGAKNNMGNSVSICTWWRNCFCNQCANEFFRKENFR